MTEYSDSTYQMQLVEYIDPIVDLWFSKRGRVSRRRFINMARMRLKPLYKGCNMDPAWVKQFVRGFSDEHARRWVAEALQPGYRISQPGPAFAPLGEESGPFDRNE